MNAHVYVDMDGVLADFTLASCRFFGLPNDNTLDDVLNSKRGWPRLQKEWPTFWMDLPKMPYAMDLWRLVKPHHPSILTALPQSWPSAAAGKHVWVKRHLPKFGMHPRQTFHAVQRHQKQQYATQADGTPNILIDDHEKNIAEWKSAGGHGVFYLDGRAGLSRVEAQLNSTFR